MAKKPRTDEIRDAVLSYDDMQAAIRKIDRRLADLDAFDIEEIHDRDTPEIEAIGVKINTLLVDVFGSNSTEYHRYNHIPNIDTAGYSLDGTSIYEIREGLVSGIGRAKATLEAIKQGFLVLRTL
ncbi:MAG: hypothetical protein VCD66_06010 [Alphaproteobacteria bacterium]|jgi:hypothetical protein